MDKYRTAYIFNTKLYSRSVALGYQGGEEVVVVLCHHPHGLGLETQEGNSGLGSEQTVD